MGNYLPAKLKKNQLWEFVTFYQPRSGMVIRSFPWDLLLPFYLLSVLSFQTRVFWDFLMIFSIFKKNYNIFWIVFKNFDFIEIVWNCLTFFWNFYFYFFLNLWHIWNFWKLFEFFVWNYLKFLTVQYEFNISAESVQNQFKTSLKTSLKPVQKQFKASLNGFT